MDFFFGKRPSLHFLSNCTVMANTNMTKARSQYIVHDVEDPLSPRSPPTFRLASDNGQIVSEHERLGLVRGLSQRHVQMIAIAGAIGTGLFLGLGTSIATGGPLGALLGYAFVGVVVCAIQFALGEVAALMPVTGSFVRHAELLVNPALVPSEISASVVLIQYWTDISAAVWVTILIVVSVVVAISLVRIYGEIEFILAILKILLVEFVVILGLVIDLGGVPGVPRRGFHFWKDPGPFVEYIATGSWGRFLGFWAVMTNAVYSFTGVESLAMAAAETKNPRQNIPKACKRVFARVSIFYLAAVLIVGMLVSSADPRLGDDSGTAATSPFVLAASDAGIKVIPSIVNAVCLTSACAMNVFWWFVDLTAAGTLVSWIAIALNHIRLLQALKKQGISPDQLPWHNPITNTSWFALISCIVILLTGGFAVFTDGHWDVATFVSSYLDIPLVLLAYGGYKLIRRTKIIPLDEALFSRRSKKPTMTLIMSQLRGTACWQRINIFWG
ncbi:Amino acid/polyamine transporter I [Penicillium maclennaniae]|uniref:Amino acid/polyamine transporter I n=1 Tax=Penicillium maclennaniae TaxID=1343394 RepID=UPI002540AE12|nr:Amino acid/polyamine transporter I [Penicillium maclennaniae]KAJ5662324.1 Amino acid/polyamine transporter I [Penicillium maclennaniae]